MLAELTSYRVGIASTSRTLATFRQFVLKARGVEESTEALPDEWANAPKSNAYLLSDSAELVGTIRVHSTLLETDGARLRAVSTSKKS